MDVHTLSDLVLAISMEGSLTVIVRELFRSTFLLKAVLLLVICITLAFFFSVECRTKRDELLRGTQIRTVRCIVAKKFESIEELYNLMINEQSAYATNQPIEGVYIRSDEREMLRSRAKLVRAGFIQVCPLYPVNHPTARAYHFLLKVHICSSSAALAVSTIKHELDLKSVLEAD